MSFLTVPALVTRAGKGAALSAPEHDANLTTLKNFCNSLAALMGVSLNVDGTLKDGSVADGDIAARSVGSSELAATALGLLLDTSATVNVFTIAPAPAITQYEDGQFFFIRSNATNTSTCQINASGLGLKGLKKRGGLEIEAGDIQRHQIFCVCYYGGEFELVASFGSGGGSDSATASGFSGFATYTPSNTALPVAATPVAVGTFSHNFNQQPSMVSLRLICITPELGYTAGQTVPLDQVVDASGNEAFTVQVGDNDITVTLIATPKLANTGTGAFTAITLANWKLVLSASLVTATSTPTMPALTYCAKRPIGVMSNGNDLFFAEYRNGTVLTARVDTTNNNMTRIAPAGTNPNHVQLNAAPFRRSDGNDYFVFTSSTGIYYMPMAAPYQPVFVTATVNSANYQRKPVWITESGGGIVQLLATGYINEQVTALNLYANASYNHGGTLGVIGTAALGTALDLRSASILSADGTAGNVEFRNICLAGDLVVLFQYNKIKKRLYVVTRDTMALSIFEIVGDTSAYTEDTASFLEWWLDAGRLGKLQYKKTIMLAGAGDYVADLDEEHYYIDWNLDTGAERAIVFGRTGNLPYGGSITRIPWRE